MVAFDDQSVIKVVKGALKSSKLSGKSGARLTLAIGAVRIVLVTVRHLEEIV